MSLKVIWADPGEHIQSTAERCVASKANAFVHNERLYQISLTWTEHEMTQKFVEWAKRAPGFLNVVTVDCWK